MGENGNVNTITKSEFEYTMRMSLDEVTSGQIKKVVKSGNKFDVWFSSYITLKDINEIVSVFNKTMDTNYEVVEGSYSNTSLGKRVTIQKEKTNKMAKGGKITIKDVDWANDDNKQLGVWLLTSVDGNKILSQSTCKNTLEDNVMKYYKKKGSIAKMKFDEDSDDGLAWVTFGDLYEEVRSVGKEKYAKGGKIVESGDTLLPAGKYYVGDLCYVLHDEWDEVCKLTIKENSCINGVFRLKDGTMFALYGTAYGDGQYTDGGNREYGVDSGTLGCVLVSKVDLSNKDNDLDLGNVIDFKEPFETGYSDDEQQIVFFGNVEIHTGYEENEDDEEDEEDEYDYEEDENEDEDEYARGGNISYYKNIVQKTLKELGYNLKQEDFKVGVKKQANYELITLNGELLCSNGPNDQMVKWIETAIKKDPSKYGLNAKGKNEINEYAKGGVVDSEGNKEVDSYKGHKIYDKGESAKTKYRYYMRGKEVYAPYTEAPIVANGTTIEKIKSDFENLTEYAKGGMVVTSIKDIPNFKQRLEEGKITYRGLGMGKIMDDFLKIAGESGTRIKVDGKEYYITETEFNTFSRGSDGRVRIKFAAPYRKMATGGGIGSYYSNINKTWKSNTEITNDVKNFIIESNEAGGEDLSDIVIDAMEKGLVMAKHEITEEYATGGEIESFDSDYWLQYNENTSMQGSPEWFSTKDKDFEQTFEDAVDYWNEDAEEGAELKGIEINRIKNTAKKFFEKEKWISTNIIHAMIFQEAGSDENENENDVVPGLNAENQLSNLQVESLYQGAPALNNPYYPKSLIKQVGDVAYYKVIVNNDEYLLAMDTTGNWDDKWYFIRTPNTMSTVTPKETGSAGIKIELQNGDITVYHSSSEEVLLNLPDVPEGTWSKLWDFLKNDLV